MLLYEACKCRIKPFAMSSRTHIGYISDCKKYFGVNKLQDQTMPLSTNVLRAGIRHVEYKEHNILLITIYYDRFMADDGFFFLNLASSMMILPKQELL